MEYNFVFLNPICIGRGTHYVVTGPTYVAEFLRNTLDANGIRNCQFAIDNTFSRKTLTRALGEMYLRVWRLIRPDRLNIVGVTNWATNSRLTRALMSALQLQSHEANIPLLVVGGGPFLAREQLWRNGTTFPDSVEASLANSGNGERLAPYDAVVYGGFQALIDLLQAVAEDAVQFTGTKVMPAVLPTGYYHRQDGRIEGSGCARNAAIAESPVYCALQLKKFDAMIMFSNNCANRCDYCSTGQKYRFSSYQIRQGIKSFRNRLAYKSPEKLVKRMRYLKLLDPNAFADFSRSHTYECLDVVRSELGFKPAIHCFYDSYYFRKPEKVLADIRELNLRRIAIGREAVCEEGLSFIGRRYLGKPRTCEMLQEERAGLVEVIRKQKEVRRKLDILLDYIISPADTWGSIEATFRDMKYFCDMSDKTVRVRVHWEPLWPNAGTIVMHKYTHLFSDDPYFAPTNMEVWNMSAIQREYPRSAFPQFLTLMSSGVVATIEGMLERIGGGNPKPAPAQSMELFRGKATDAF
jgi:hypothetical protein